jgi:hypothetical protein
MGETVQFPRARRRAPKPPSGEPTLSPAACELWRKVVLLDRIRPGAVQALDMVAGRFVAHRHSQAKAKLPAPRLVASRRRPTIRRRTIIKMLQAKLAHLATCGPADGYDAEDIAVLRHAYESHIRAERTLIRARRIQSVLSLALVGT